MKHRVKLAIDLDHCVLAIKVKLGLQRLVKFVTVTVHMINNTQIMDYYFIHKYNDKMSF